MSSSAAVPAKSAWNNAPLEKTEKLPARVKARLVRGERKLSPAATAAWKNAEPTEGATLTGAAVASLVRALLGPDERADGPRDKGAFAAAHASDTSSIASDASSLARDTSTVSTVTVTAYDDGAWETVSGKKDRARLNDRAKKNARASGDARDEARARRARGGRRASDDGTGQRFGDTRSETSGGFERSALAGGGDFAAASSENGSASCEDRAVSPKPPKGWAAILTGRASSAQLTPSEAAALAAEEAAKEAAALKELRAREEEEAAREAAAAEERQKALRAAVAGAPASKSATRAPEEPPTRAAMAAAGSLPPSRANSPKPSGPWASVVLGAGAGAATAATDGWRSLVEGTLDAEAAPQVTVTLDGGADWNRIGDGQDKKTSGRASPASGMPHKALSPLESAPAMPVVRAAKKLPEAAPARTETLPGGISALEPGVAPAQPSWSGWAVKSPPPKVDLKAEMEAALVTRAASPKPAGGNAGGNAGSAPGSPAVLSRRAEGDAANTHLAASPKKKAGKVKDVLGVLAPPPPADRSVRDRAGVKGSQTDAQTRGADRTREHVGSFSPPPPPTSPPLTLPGASRFPPRPFAPPPAPPRAPAPAALQPRLDAAIDGGVPASSQTARRALAVRLGAEMLDAAHVKPDSRGAATLAAERRAADALIRAAHAQAQDLFPSAAAEVFGSFPTNAWVPGASNVDVALALPDAVASTPRLKMEALEALAAALRRNAWAESVTVVHSALRPLIFVSTHTAHFHSGHSGATAKAGSKPADGLASAAASPPLPPGPPPSSAAAGASPPPELGTPLEVHISVKDRNHKGAATVKFLRQAEAEYPAFSSVLCVLKAWLAKKGLRGVYKGGIGSYSLALLALHALQRKAHDDAEAAEAAKAAKAESDSDGLAETDAVPSTPGKKDKDPTRDAETLGASLLHFLEFYGQQVDLTKAAVVAHPLRPTGKAAKKAAAAASASESPEWGVVPVRVPGGGPPIAAVGAGGLTVSDPTQPGHNAGGGCFGIAGVQASFREQLAAIGSLPGDASLLGALVAPAANGRGFVV